MKQWLAGYILSADNLRVEESFTGSKKEFYMSLSMVCLALALFTAVIRIFGA